MNILMSILFCGISLFLPLITVFAYFESCNDYNKKFNSKRAFEIYFIWLLICLAFFTALIFAYKYFMFAIDFILN